MHIVPATPQQRAMLYRPTIKPPEIIKEKRRAGMRVLCPYSHYALHSFHAS